MPKKKTKQNKSSGESTQVQNGKFVEKRAYEIWLDEGCPQGRSLENWLQAEQELHLLCDAGCEITK